MSFFYEGHFNKYINLRVKNEIYGVFKIKRIK